MFKRFLALTLAFALFATTWLMPTTATTVAPLNSAPDISTEKIVDFDFSSGTWEEKGVTVTPFEGGTVSYKDSAEIGSRVTVFPIDLQMKFKTTPDIKNLTDITIETFVKITTDAETDVRLITLGNGHGGTTGIREENGKAVFGVAGMTATSEAGLPRNEWIHIAATRNESGLFLYINGNVVAQASNSSTAVVGDGTGTTSIYIGSWENGIDLEMANFKMYKSAATAEQVTELYAACPKTEEPTPVPTPALEESLVFNADYTTSSHKDQTNNFSFDRDAAKFPISENDGVLSLKTDYSIGSLKYTGSGSLDGDATFEVYFLSSDANDHQLLGFGKALYLEYDTDTGFGFYNGGPDNGVFQGTADSSQYLNKWTHVVGVVDNGTAKIYLDGKAIAEGSMTIDFSGGANRIDAGHNDSAQYHVAFARIYDNAASAEEVKALFNACPKTEEPTPTLEPTPTPVPTPTLEESLVFDADYTTNSHNDQTNNFSFDRDAAKFPISENDGVLSLKTDYSIGSLKYTGSGSLDGDATFEVYFLSSDANDHQLLGFGKALYLEYDTDTGFGFYNGGPDNGVFQGTADSSQYLNKWTHVVGVVDNGTAKIYLDGKAIAEGTMTIDFSGGADRIDAGHNASAQYHVAFARIYDNAASAEEVTALFNACPKAEEPTPTLEPTPTPVPTPTLEESLVFNADYTTNSHDDITENFSFKRDPGAFPIVKNDGILSTTTAVSSLKYEGSELSVGDTVTFETYFRANEIDGCFTLLQFNQNLLLELDPNSGFGFVEKGSWTGIYEYPTGGVPIENYLGKWMHVVGVVKDGIATIYVNGVKLVAGEISGSFSGTRVDAGCIAMGATKAYHVAFARIYDNAASAEEVKALFNACPKAEEPTPTLEPTPTPVPTPTLEESLVFNADYTTNSHNDITENFSFGRDPSAFPIVKKDGIPSITSNRGIGSLKYTGSEISLGDTATYEAYFYSDDATGTHELVTFGGAGLVFKQESGFGFGDSVNQGTADNSLYLGKWTHVVAVVGNGTVTIYLNGEKLLSDSLEASISGNRVDAGYDRDGSSEYNLAFARIYDNAATAEEVTALFNACPKAEEPTPTPVPTPALEGSLVFNADYTTGSHNDITENFSFGRDPGAFPIVKNDGILSTTAAISSLKYEGSELSVGDTVTFETYFRANEIDGCFTLVKFGKNDVNLRLELDPGSGFGFVENNTWTGIYEYPTGGVPIENYLGKWMHVVGVVKDGIATIYVNGVKLADGDISGSFGGTRVDAGYLAEGATKAYHVAFTRIYDDAATAEEVTALFNACPKPDVEPVPDHLELISGETTLTLTEDYLRGVINEQTAADILAKFESNEYVVIVGADGSVLADEAYVGTGCSVRLVNGEDVIDEVQVIVKGDTDGDGVITTADYLRIKKFFLQELELNAIQFLAADTDGSGDIATADYMKIRSHFAGTYDLYQNA